jgi:hypothetical protein
MKILINIIFTLMLTSCQNSNQNIDSLSNFSILKNNLNEITFIDSEVFVLSQDFLYPKHSYFILQGTHSNLNSLIKKVGVNPYLNKNVLNSNIGLNEYSNGRLWGLEGFYENKLDTLFRLRHGLSNIKKESTFSAYINSGNPNKLFYTSDNNWNGKIVFFLRADTCFVFIEELKSPNFKRIN